MKKLAFAAAFAAVSFWGFSAQAGGLSLGNIVGGATGVSSGLLNVSPTIGLGNVSVANGNSILNGAGVLNGSNVSNILQGTVGVANGVLSGVNLGVLGGNTTNMSKSKHRR